MKEKFSRAVLVGKRLGLDADKIRTWGQLASKLSLYSRHDIMRIEGVGVSTLRYIEDMLHRYGLCLSSKDFEPGDENGI